MPTNSNSLCTTWYRRVREYTRSKLIKESDRLIAFSGVVQSFGQPYGVSIADDYLAGLWRAHLPAALCWTTNSPTKRSVTYMAPSWSWASLEGDFILEVDDDLLQKQCFASMRRIWSNTNVDSPPAKLAMGDSIELHGYVFELKMECGSDEASQCDLSVVLDPDLGGSLYWDEHIEGKTVISYLDGPVIPHSTQEGKTHNGRERRPWPFSLLAYS